MSEHQFGRGGRYGRQHVGIREPPGHVVDDPGARTHCRQCGGSIHRVDADRDSRLGERRNDREHPLLLHARLDALRTRTRRLPADVEQVRSLGAHPEGACDRDVGIDVTAPITEGVGVTLTIPMMSVVIRATLRTA